MDEHIAMIAIINYKILVDGGIVFNPQTSQFIAAIIAFHFSPFLCSCDMFNLS